MVRQRFENSGTFLNEATRLLTLFVALQTVGPAGHYADFVPISPPHADKTRLDQGPCQGQNLAMACVQCIPRGETEIVSATISATSQHAAGLSLEPSARRVLSETIVGSYKTEIVRR